MQIFNKLSAIKLYFKYALCVYLVSLNLSFSPSSSPLPTLPVHTDSEQVFKRASRGDEPFLYWFFIRVVIDHTKDDYTVIGTASRLQGGERKVFEHDIWWGLTNQQIAIGPFLDAEEAENARLSYRKTLEKVPVLAMTELHREMHWFMVSFSSRKRSRSYKLESVPTRVASGTLSDYLNALYQGLSYEQLAVGAFWDYNQAEIAMKVYSKAQ